MTEVKFDDHVYREAVDVFEVKHTGTIQRKTNELGGW